MLKIGIISSAYKNDSYYGIDFKRFKDRGYDGFDYQDFMNPKSVFYKMDEKDFEKYFVGLKKELDNAGLICYQLHSLWNTETERDDRANLYSYYIKAIKGAHYLGCGVVVMHSISPINWETPFTIEEVTKATTDLVNALLPYLKEYNIILAIENLPFLSPGDYFSPLGTLRFVNSFNDEHVAMCLDTGHLNIFKEDIYEDILKIGDKLAALHIHDNNSWTDSHNFPYMGSIKWDRFIDALKAIKYKGVLSLETQAPKSSPKEIYDQLDNALFDIICDFRNRIG